MILNILYRNPRLTIILMMGFLALTFSTFAQNDLAQSIQFNLTGIWKADDGGTYYIRNIDKNVWWLGIGSNDDGKTFSNVLKGYINETNKILKADWADIPLGNNKYYGTLTLSIDSNTTLHKVNESSYNNGGIASCCFGASIWQR